MLVVVVVVVVVIACSCNCSYSLQRFRIYLQDTKLKIITNCNSFKLALSKKSKKSYKLERRSSTQVGHGDALRRTQSIQVIEKNIFVRHL